MPRQPLQMEGGGVVLMFIDLFGAVLGLRCCAWPSSSCSQRGPLSIWGAQASHCCGFSCRRAWAPGACGLQVHVGSRRTWAPVPGLAGSGGSAQQLWRTGSVAPRRVQSSQTRDRASALGVARRTLTPLDHEGSPSQASCLIYSQPYISPQLAQSRSWPSQAPARLFATRTPGTL